MGILNVCILNIMNVKYKNVSLLVFCLVSVSIAAGAGYVVGHANGYKSGMIKGSRDAYDYSKCLFLNGGSEVMSNPSKCLDSKGTHVWPKPQ
jgi:hypothetical protein